MMPVISWAIHLSNAEMIIKHYITKTKSDHLAQTHHSKSIASTKKKKKWNLEKTNSHTSIPTLTTSKPFLLHYWNFTLNNHIYKLGTHEGPICNRSAHNNGAIVVHIPTASMRNRITFTCVVFFRNFSLLRQFIGFVIGCRGALHLIGEYKHISNFDNHKWSAQHTLLSITRAFQYKTPLRTTMSITNYFLKKKK